MKSSKHIIIFFFIVLAIASCNSEKKKSDWPPHKNESFSMEILNGDTCNRLIYGYRQGKWYLVDSALMRRKGIQNAIIDTVFYRNDTIIEN